MTRQRIHRKDIRLALQEEKEEIYKLINELTQLDIPISIKEHKSGFPAITVDCGEIHILTDILSLEAYWAKKKGGKVDISEKDDKKDVASNEALCENPQ